MHALTNSPPKQQQLSIKVLGPDGFTADKNHLLQINFFEALYFAFSPF